MGQAEFYNMRPGNYTKRPRDEAFCEDAADDHVFQKAQHIFVSNLEAYNITRESCHRVICPQVKHIFDPLGNGTSSFPNGAQASSALDRWPSTYIADDALL